MVHYRPESKDVSDLLRRSVARVLYQMWPQRGVGSTALELTTTEGDELYERIQALSPQNEAQRSLKADARQITVDVGRTRSLLMAQSVSTFLRLFAPGNLTVVATLLVRAVGLSGDLPDPGT